METVNTLAKAVKLLRTKTGMTQKELGALLHVTKGQVSKYENNRDGITLAHDKVLQRLLKKNEIKIDYGSHHRDHLEKGLLREFNDLDPSQKIAAIKSIQQMSALNLIKRMDSYIDDVNQIAESEQKKINDLLTKENY